MLEFICMMVLSLCLFETECSDIAHPISVHRRYDKSLKMVAGILNGNDSNTEHNVLMSPIASARDATFLLSVISKRSRNRLPNYLAPYRWFSIDLRNIIDHIVESTSGDAEFNTAFYTRQRNLPVSVNKAINSSFSKESFTLLSEHKAPEPSYAIYTQMSWNITMIKSDGSKWMEATHFFHHSSTSPLNIRALNMVGSYDYAEFKHPKANNCTLKALRLSYTSELTLNFVLQLNYDSEDCMLKQDLWTNMKDVDLRRLNYTNRRLFVKLPVFRARANVDLKKRLEDTPLGETMTLKAQQFQDAIMKHSILFNFVPEIDGPIPSISPDTMGFFVDHSFYFAISHGTSQTPVLAGLINNPLDLQEDRKLDD